jgi:hypothetical protein
MKDNLITIFALTMFTLVLVFGVWMLLIATMVLLPVALLKCMIDTNDQRNESI